VENYSSGSRPFQIDPIFLDEESERDGWRRLFCRTAPPGERVRARALIKEFFQHPDFLAPQKNILITRLRENG
jgi:hypothetical protein